MLQKLGLFFFILFTLNAQSVFAEEFCVDERVVTDSHYKGTIIAVYSDETADIKFDTGETHNWPTSRISAISTRINGFSVNDRVVSDSHHKGTIIVVYSDETADIKFDTGETHNWPTSRISKIQNCIGYGSCN